MVKEIVPTYQEYDPSKSISAGSFEKNPWWQRINPFTPSDPYRFKPSDEGQQIVDHFRNRYGRNVNIQPNAPETEEGVAGYFQPMGKGGSFDPKSRTVYLDKEHPTAFTLSHELGHAFDPNLVPLHDAGIEQITKAGEGWVKDGITPAEFLNRFAGTGGLDDAIFKAEVEAQKQGADVYDQYGFSDQDRTNDLGAYPYAYVDRGISQAENALTAPYAPKDLHKRIAENRNTITNRLGPRQIPYKTNFDLGMTHPNTFFDYSDQDVRSQLGLALNQDYQKAKTNIQHTAKDYLKEQLGDNTNPTKRTPSEKLDLAVKRLLGY
jgi:hypothetical protein